MYRRILGPVLLALLLGSPYLAPAGAAETPAPTPTAPSVPAPASSAVAHSVVKVFSTMREPDVLKPWTKQAPAQATGSGVVIEGERILTNAHVVLYASEIQIQGNQAGDKINATVEFIAPGIDLAVLKLDDPSFFATHPPLERASQLPKITDTVLTYGYPFGGSSLSITKGIVSRIEYAAYNYFVTGLKIQVDAAINPGNSGGPVMSGDKMIGLAFSRLLANSQNIGYIIPSEEIELFLKDIAHGHYSGKPALYGEFQTLENPALRAFLKLDPSVQGLVLRHPFRTDAAYPLKAWDVITAIGDTPVDDQGDIKVDEDLRVDFRYRVQQFTHEGKLPLSVARNGKILKLEVPVAPERPMLIRRLGGEYPPYFAYGPLVFSRLSVNLIEALVTNVQQAGNFAYRQSPLMIDQGIEPSAEREELVVVSSPFFPDKLAEGYSSPRGEVVQSINDVPVRSLKQLVAQLRDLKDEYVIVKYYSYGGETMFFKRTEMVAQTEHILEDNGVRAQGSSELMAIWQGKGAAK